MPGDYFLLGTAALRNSNILHVGCDRQRTRSKFASMLNCSLSPRPWGDSAGLLMQNIKISIGFRYVQKIIPRYIPPAKGMLFHLQDFYTMGKNILNFFHAIPFRIIQMEMNLFDG